MKKLIILFSFLSLAWFASAQPDDPKTLYQTARSFMMQADWDNAILVLNRALQLDKNNLEFQKDMIQCFYYKRDFEKAIDGIKNIINRDDADVMTFQLAGNVYKALEDPKECEKVYKQGIRKFPKSGPLYSEYGELLWSKKDFSAIDQWEKGIEIDPAFGGNYYNASLFYFYTKEKIWGLIYGEIFVNMESLSQRGAAMKELLLKGYKEKLFAEADILKGEENNKSTFAKAYKAGVKIAFGTDAAVFKHGLNWKEFTYMVDAGMPAMEAIKAATINAADLLGMKNQLGSIEVGKIADVVAVDGNPLKDPQVFGKVIFVMKDGVVYKNQAMGF